ncbi:MAG: UpxY family transcription antiterminator [Ignavibacteriales bacterium]|nr:MAG: UpxY family transcription antiterminator [Ignavibacteriales bacterium]
MINELTHQRHWFALYTKPRSEFKAAKQIEEAGVEFYLPSVTRLKQWSDRKKKVTEPLLRGYIFIFADEKERILSLTQPSVVRCVSDKGSPAKIPAWQIDNLRKMLQTETEYIIKEGLVPGVRIRILDGPFKDVVAVYREEANEKTIAVSIELLNRSVLAHLPKESSYEILKEQ